MTFAWCMDDTHDRAPGHLIQLVKPSLLLREGTLAECRDCAPSDSQTKQLGSTDAGKTLHQEQVMSSPCVIAWVGQHAPRAASGINVCGKPATRVGYKRSSRDWFVGRVLDAEGRETITPYAQGIICSCTGHKQIKQ